MVFNKENWLINARDEFKTICRQIVDNSNTVPEFTDILGEVIENDYREFNSSNDLFELIGYEESKLNQLYEFDEKNFHEYFDNHSFIKSYKDALNYYSLNQLFLDNFEEELEKYIEDISQ